MSMQCQRVVELIVVLLVTASICVAQQGPYQTSDPYFGTVEVTIDTNGFPGHGDSTMLVVEGSKNVLPYLYQMVYYREGEPMDSAVVHYKKPTKRVVPSGLYTMAFTRRRPVLCHSWLRCTRVPLIPGSVVTLRVTIKDRPHEEDDFPKYDFFETKLNSLRVVPGYSNDQTKGQTTSTLILRVRDSLHVPYPFGAVFEMSSGSGAKIKSAVFMLNDTVTTLTVDTGEVRVSIDSRFRDGAILEFRTGANRELPQPITLRSGDTVIFDVTLGGMHTIDSAALFGGYQRMWHFNGSTSVRHEKVVGMSSRDSGVLALEVVDAATQLPIPKAYAKVSESFFRRDWIVGNGASSFAVPTGAYRVSCDPTGPYRCWNVSREGVLLIPGQRTIVRFEMNMKQSSP